MQKQSIKKEFSGLGTEINIELIVSSSEIKKAWADLETVARIYQEQEKIFSRFNPQSELCQLNAKLGQWQKASAEMLEVAKLCLEYYQKTDGFFDPRIIDVLENSGYRENFRTTKFSEIKLKLASINNQQPLTADLLIKENQLQFKQRMDFSGIVKGYITDKVADFLRHQGWQNFLVNSGGDMNISGECEDGCPWLIEIEGLDLAQCCFNLSNQAIATSGISRRKWEIDGQRVHHLVHPFKPSHFDFSLRSVTVVAPNTTQADIWAKFLFLKGKEQGSRWAKENQIECLFLDYSGSALRID